MNKKFTINGKEVEVQDYKQSQESVSFVLNGKSHSYSLVSRDGFEMVISKNGERFKAAIGTPSRDGESMVIAAGAEANIGEAGKRIKKSGAQAGGLTSPMPGKIFKIVKGLGEPVKKGEVILILEAMKMEHAIRSDKDGRVKQILFKVGELVQGGVTLAEVEP